MTRATTRATVYLTDGAELSWAHFDTASLLDLRAELEAGEAEGSRWLTFEMDGATVLVQRSHVVRIDVEGPE